MFQRSESSQQANEQVQAAKPRRSGFLLWLFSLLLCTLATAASFAWIDIPVAAHVFGRLTSAAALATGFASVFLLGAEAVVALSLIIIRIVRGHLSPFREATALACLTSICAYAVDDGALKAFFGVPFPWQVLQGTEHAFRLFSGYSNSSFPSGHMVIAGAFAGVFMRLYRISILPLVALLLLAATLLIVGDGHFVSDVIAGAFVGISAGLLAGEVWLAHSR